MMTLQEALSLTQSDFETVCSYSQNCTTDLDAEKILTNWYYAKSRFIEAMGGKLIYEHPVPIHFELGDRDKDKKLNTLREMVLGRYNNEELFRFIDRQKMGFFNNTVVEEEISPSGAKIPKGMKLLKAFKFFENSPVALDEIQSTASRLIQENKIEGRFCISVHPLDYLSSSENTHNWRSCHALDGEFRAGNLSYMCDEVTLVCYLKSENGDKFILPSFPPSVPWNSKKWRMLLYVNTSDNCMFAGRQYPFFSENALNTVKAVAIHALKLPDCWSGWHDDQIDAFNYKNGQDNIFNSTRNRVICVDNKFHVLDKFVKDQSQLHYNDLLKSSCYIPYYCWADEGWNQRHVKMFKVGSEPICPICGDAKVTYSETLFCDRCTERFVCEEDDIYGECECCGHTIYDGDDFAYVVSHWGAELLVCGDCIVAECSRCDCCGRLAFNNEMIYDREADEYICERCNTARKEQKEAEELSIETPPTPVTFTAENVQWGPGILDLLNEVSVFGEASVGRTTSTTVDENGQLTEAVRITQDDLFRFFAERPQDSDEEELPF